MKIGDLVTIAPAKTGTYIITSLKGFSSGVELPDCVTVASLNGEGIGYNLPMGKEWIEVISESR
jgi:hypothetical protein